MSESSSYYYYTPAFTEEERESLKDFFGRDLFSGSYSPTAKELTDEQIDQISSRIMPSARRSLRTMDLLPTLRKYKVLTDTEYLHLKSGTLEQQEQAIRLMEYLMYKGSYGLAALYLSLLTSSECKGGLPAHYQLARELKELVQEYGATDEVTTSVFESPAKGSEVQTTSLRATVKKLQGISISPVSGQMLAAHLDLPSHQASSTDLCELCCAWLSSSPSTCDMMALVEAMVITEGVGRYTSRLCGPTTVPPRDLRNFILTLGEQWAEIAKYLGFSGEEITAITDNYPDSIAKQVDLFLEKWKMPDSGQKTLPLMHKLKGLAGIVEPKRGRADSLPYTRRPQLDDSGVPPKRLDAYSHPTRLGPSSTSSPASHSHSQHHTHHQTHHHVHDIEGSDEEYIYCPKHDTYHPRGHFRVTIYQTVSGEGWHDEMRNGQYGSYRSSDRPYRTDQDPVIEELPSDSSELPRSKPQRHVMGNDVTVSDRLPRALPPSASTSKSSKSTPPSATSLEGKSSTGLLGNEVLTDHAPSSLHRSHSDESKGSARRSEVTPPSGAGSGRLGKEVAPPSVAGSGRLGNEVTPPSVAGSGRLGNEVTPPSGAGSSRLGNEVTPPSVAGSGRLGKEVAPPSGAGSSRLGNEVIPPSVAGSGCLGNEVTPPSGAGSGRLGNEVTPPSGAGSGRLGNEVTPPSVAGSGRLGNEVTPPSVAGSGRLGNEVTPPSGAGSGRLGKEVIPPSVAGSGRLGKEVTQSSSIGSGYLGNEVPVGLQGSGVSHRGRSGQGGGVGKQQEGQRSRGSLELLGNEVSMPGGRGSKKLGTGVTSPQPPSMSIGSLGNEVPLPRSPPVGGKVLSDEGRGGVTVRASLPVGVGGGYGRGRGPHQLNEADNDSGYTTVSEPSSFHSVQSTGHRKPLRSDSSSDSTPGLQSRKFTFEPKSLQNFGGSGSMPRDSSPSVGSRTSSPDNNLSSGEEEDDSMSPVTQPSSQLHNQTPSFPSTMSSQNSEGRAQSPPLQSSPRVLPSPDVTLREQSGSSSTHSVQMPHVETGTSGPERVDGVTDKPSQLQSVSEGFGTGVNEEYVGGGDDEDNNLDDDEDEAEFSNQNETSHMVALPLQDPPQVSEKNGESFQPDSHTEGGHGRGGIGGEEIDNDLSVPTPESTQERTLSQPVFMQSSYTLPPDNEIVVVDSPTMSLASQSNDLTTNEGAEPTSDVTHPLRHAEFEGNETVKEYCSEDVIQAIQDRNGMDMLTALVNSGANINLPAPDGSYPIHVAVATKRHETVLFLLNKAASLKERRNDGKTPLHIACLQKDFEMVQILVEKGADVAAQDKQGYTCLHFKETLETLTIVQYLAHNGAPIDTPSHESYLTPLMICCSAGNESFNTAQFLITKGASVDGCEQAGMKPLIVACTEGFEKLVDLLLDNNADVNILDHDGNSALLKACQGGFVSIARKLCERQSDSNSMGADVNHANNDGLTPIMAAVLCDKIELVKILITHRANVNCYKVHKLSVCGSDVMLEMSPLASAAAQGNIEMVELLVENRANVNATTTAMAPVAFAAMCGQTAAVRHFLKLNDLDVSLHAIAQPFTQAVKFKQGQCAELLAERYGGLERVYGDSTQSNMQELADAVRQLQQMQRTVETVTTTSSVAPSNALPNHPPSTHDRVDQISQQPQSPPDTTFTNEIASSQQSHSEREFNDEDLNNLSEGEEEENNLDDDEQTAVPVSTRDNSVHQLAPPTPVQGSTSQLGLKDAQPPEPVKVHVGVGVASKGRESFDLETENNLDVGEASGELQSIPPTNEVGEELNNLDAEAQNDLDTEPQNNLDAEPQNNLDTEPQNNLDAEAQNNLDAEPQNNLDAEAQNNLDAEPQNNLDAEAQNNLDAEPQNNLDAEPQNNLDGEAQNNLDSEAQNNLDAEPQNNLDGEAQNNLDAEAQNNLDGEAQNNLDSEAQNNLDAEPQNNLDGEAQNNLDAEPQNNLDSEAQNNLDAEAQNNLDSEVQNDLDSEAQNNLDSEAQNNLDVDEVVNYDVTVPSNVAANEVVGSHAEVQNNLDADEAQSSHDAEAQNNFDDVEAQNNLDTEEVVQHGGHTEVVSQPPSSVAASASMSQLVASSNVVPTPLSTPSMSNSSTSTVPAFRATVPRTADSSGPVRSHDLTEHNQFDDDDDKQNDFSDDEASSNSHDLKGPPRASVAATNEPLSAYAQQQQERWRASLDDKQIPPAPVSAPVGQGFSGSSHHSKGPLRASVDSTSFTSHPSDGGENLFAPRPKSPPPRAPTPPPSSVIPQNLPTMVHASSSGLQQGGGVEVLHDFAQICMMAAVRTKGQEWLINKAMETGYENLTQFFLQYFHEGMALSIGGKLVSEFIGGNPSPLNFLLAGRFINETSFNEVASELGQSDFMDSLTVALHHFPGSDGLPYTGSEMATALFNQTFSIGHRYPDPGSLLSSSPPVHNSAGSQYSFPGQGHQLGRNTTENQYSNFSEPAFHSSGGGSTNTSQPSSSSVNNFTSELSSSSVNNFTLPETSAPSTSTQSLPSTNATSTADAALLHGSPQPSQPASSLPVQQTEPPPMSQSTAFSPSTSVPPPSSTATASNDDRMNELPVSGTSGDTHNAVPTLSGHTLTEENVLDDEEVEPLNDLSTADDDSSGYFVPKTNTDEGYSELLGNEIEVKPVSHSRSPVRTQSSSSAYTPMPTSAAPETPMSSATPTASAHTPHANSQTPAGSVLSPSTPSPPPLSTVAPTPTLRLVLPAKNKDPLSGSVVQPETSPALAAKVVSGIVESFPPSLTPSPDLPETVVDHTVLQSPRSSPPPPASTYPSSSGEKLEHASAPVEKQSKQAPSRPQSGGSTGSKGTPRLKQSHLNQGKDVPSTKVSRGATSKGRTTTGTASSSRIKQPATISKPPTSLGKKKAEVGTSKGLKVPAKPVNPKTTSKGTTATPKSRLQTKLPKTSSLPPQTSRSTENLHTKKKTSSLQSSTKPTSPHLSKTSVTRTKVHRAGTAAAAATHTTAMSRGLQKQKGSKNTSTGTSASSLTNEEAAGSVHGSMPFKTLEPASVSEFSAPSGTERYGLSVSDASSFPDIAVQNPESCTVLQELAHRIRKWKIFGRYLGVGDDELDNIEQSNHYTTERCLKMLVQWVKKYQGKYSELEAGLHNIMREDLIEDVRQYLPSGIIQQCSPVEEENGHLKFSGFQVEGGSPNIHILTQSVSEFVRRNNSDCKTILLRFSHAKLHSPIELYLPMPSGSSKNCDLTVLEELCFAAWKRSVSVVDLVFEIQF